MKRRVPRISSRIGPLPPAASGRSFDRRDGLRVVRRAEHRGAGDQHIGPGLDAARRGLRGDAAIDLERRSCRSAPCASIIWRRTAILASWPSMKACPPKPGLTLITRTRSQLARARSRPTATGVAGFSTTPAFLPRPRGSSAACGADAGGFRMDADECRRRPRRRPGGTVRAAAIIRCTSNGIVACLRSAFTITGPMLMFGTKCPSIMSRCSQSAPAAATARVSSPSRAKSAARSEGAISDGTGRHREGSSGRARGAARRRSLAMDAAVMPDA